MQPRHMNDAFARLKYARDIVHEVRLSSRSPGVTRPLHRADQIRLIQGKRQSRQFVSLLADF
jgi:hypothetical protein